MAVTLTVNGVSFSYPQTGDSNWGDDTTNWASAVTSGMLQKAGGTFTLTADVDFGASYGLKALYYKSRATNPSATGSVRLGNTEAISWRNAANGADLGLAVNASNALQFNSVSLVLSGLIVNADIANAAAIAYSKLALTGSILNADVNASAAIAYSKLNLATSIVNADVSASAAIAYSKLALTGAILNADLAGSIAYSKLSLTGAILNADLAGSIAYSKLSLTGAILNADLAGSIANSKLATMATFTIKGNNTGGSATPSDLTATQTTAMLNAMVGDSGSGGTKGLVPAPASGDAAAAKYLKADGTWATTPSGFANPMTTGGDIIYGGVSGAGSRLANGSAGNVLQSGGGTAAPSWRTLSAPTVTLKTSGSGNYTTPTGVLYLKVTFAGGGGGGAASANASGTAAGNGVTTTFGTTLLSATGGTGANNNGGGGGGAGGTASLGGAQGYTFTGGTGGGSCANLTFAVGATGGSNPLGGAGAAGASGAAGGGAQANTGGGGGGAGAPNSATSTGGGGGAGGYGIAFLAPTANQVYAYVVGGGGSGETGSGSGVAGGAGAAGVIIIEEFYQ